MLPEILAHVKLPCMYVQYELARRKLPEVSRCMRRAVKPFRDWLVAVC